ncbi:MAG: hypothetical protein H0W68_01240 [Gemmatimonadaceae bacterium]|nr:hypothetical protein [Gemmatimonadaceae bacterium]
MGRRGEELTSAREPQRKVRAVEEYWVTGELEDIPDPMEALARAFGGEGGMPMIGGSAGDLIRRRGEAQRKLFTGFPVKTVSTTTFTERDGSTKAETATTEIIDLKRLDLDPAAFQVPAGYAKLTWRRS